MLRTYASAGLLLAASTVAAAQPGRYQIVVPPGNDAKERFLLDTTTGMTWFLIRSPCEGDIAKGPGCSIHTWTSIRFHSITREGDAGTDVSPPTADRARTVPLEK